MAGKLVTMILWGALSPTDQHIAQAVPVAVFGAATIEAAAHACDRDARRERAAGGGWFFCLPAGERPFEDGL